MIGSFHGKKTEINVIVENEGEVIYLDYPYVFINIYFCTRKSSIYSSMKTDNVYGLYMDCDFSSISPKKPTDVEQETYKRDEESFIKERLRSYVTDVTPEVSEGNILRTYLNERKLNSFLLLCILCCVKSLYCKYNILPSSF